MATFSKHADFMIDTFESMMTIFAREKIYFQESSMDI